jgi:hypothetical protein
MKRIGLLIVLVLLVSACSRSEILESEEVLTAASCTVTVAKSGGNHTTLQAAATVANPGDIVCVRAGTYREYVSFSRSGRAGQRIIYMAYPGEKVIFDGAGPTRREYGPGIFEVDNSSYLTFYGFELSNGATDGMLVYNSKYVTVNRMIFSYNHVSGVNFYSDSPNQATYNRVANSVAHHNNGTGGNSDGFKTYSDSFMTIRNNISYANSDDGFDTWLGRNNTLEFNLSYGNGWGPNGNGNGGGFKLGGLDGSLQGGYNTVRFNASYGNLSEGFNTNNGTRNILYNNTACDNPKDFRSYGTTGQELNILQNNLACNNDNNVFASSDNHSNNSWNLGISTAFLSKDTGSSTFLRLPSGSPAIDRGVNVGLTYAGSAPDLGAFEAGLRWPRKATP